MFDREKYLERLGISPPPPTLAGLCLLQEAQLRAIAFENVDPFLGVLPNLEYAAISRKLLDEGRGGYCLELNALFEQALYAFGFHPVPVLARVRMGASEGGPRAHLAFVVDVEEQLWLADAGFGGPGAAKPLALRFGEEQCVGSECYRIISDERFSEFVVEKKTGSTWFALYGFDLVSVRSSDLEAANVVCSTWRHSPFPFHLMLNRSTPQGRISLFDKNFTRTHAGIESKSVIESSGEFEKVIRGDFGIMLGQSEIAKLAERLDLCG